MIKDKILNGSSMAVMLLGYFAYDYATAINQSYGLISIILTFMLSLFIFSFSDKGKIFWAFFKEVKVELKKIYFPKAKEIFDGLGIVFIFCSISMSLIWFLDGIYLNLYQSLMN